MTKDDQMPFGVHRDFLLCGIPMIRDGDNVFFITDPSASYWKHDLEDTMERLLLSADEYRCPFDFLDEFEKWFEWHRRLRFEGKTTGHIITSMVADVERIKAHKIERPMRMYMDFGIRVSPPRSLLLSTV